MEEWKDDGERLQLIVGNQPPTKSRKLRFQLAAMIHNFNAGPSILPKEVFEEAAKAILNFRDTGLSILEIGHRTPLFESVLNETVSIAKELMKLDSDHEILFLHGGATTQFFQIPMNLLNENQTAAYLDCGVWGSKAIKEARLFGNVDVVASSKDKNYTYIPKNFRIPSDAAYFHDTTNNTIEGTEMFSIPETSVPLVADMSSDILSHVLDFNRFALIYAGAQKNIGAAGVNMVVVRKDILGKVNRNLPGMMDYRQHIEAGSMLNTPPVFAIYVCLLTLRWLKQQGGVAAIEKVNKAKADLLYNTLDAKEGFNPAVSREDRSRMNVVFLIGDPQLEKKFLDACKEQNMVGVKGHRSVGGYRVSLYNALPLESVKALTSLIDQL
jgi:phosphoserine aminotransferase